MARAATAVLLMAAMAVSQPVVAQVRGSASDFDPDELRTILRHGPWPPRFARDPSNRVSGKAEAVVLGETLFFEPRLSSTGTVSCATCHVPDRHWTDGRRVGVGVAAVDRNTPTVANTRLSRWHGWDGAGDSLWAQSIRPILDPREMQATAEHVRELLRGDPDLACRYRAAFGREAGGVGADALLVDAGKALAAFQETLVTGRTPFDDYRDALARGDGAAAARYPAAARRGLKTFAGKGLCSVCHFGPNFTNGEFNEIGIPIVLPDGTRDSGRYRGIKLMQASPYNLLRGYNDDPARASAASARHVTLVTRNFGEFKVPSLRNVALTAPYMHNGALATLRDVVRHYSEIDVSRLHQGPHDYNPDGTPVLVEPELLLRPLKLTETEIGDLVAFLESLTEKRPRQTMPRRARASCR